MRIEATLALWAVLSACNEKTSIASAAARSAVSTKDGRGEDEGDELGCAKHWGRLAAPVTGTSEAAPYAGAELFAGPNKFGSYFSGVLPNGRIVKPAGQSSQIGMNPLGAALTPDGKFLITTNDDERDGGLVSLQNPRNLGGYSISVLDTSSMQVVSTTATGGKFFVGILATGTGPYKVYVSGGADSNVKIFNVSAAGAISASAAVTINVAPIHPKNAGFANNYVPGAALNAADASGNKPPIPTGFGSRTAPTAISFPAGMAPSPDGKLLYVACNGDNSLAIIDTTSNSVVKQVPVGFFPYGVSVSADGQTVFVSNWGMTDYKFKNATYDAAGKLSAIGFASATPNQPDGFYVPPTDPARSSSVSIVRVPGGDPSAAALAASRSLGKPIDENVQVGDTHPSAVALVGGGAGAVLYVARANDDSISIVAQDGSLAGELDLSLVSGGRCEGEKLALRGTYPNAIAVSPDGTRVYVAEAGINSVAVLDARSPRSPSLLGRIPTGWYPTAVVASADGKSLYVINAKGIGEDINPKTTGNAIESFTDGNFIFGTAQKVDLAQPIDAETVLSYNVARQHKLDTSVVPDEAGERSEKIKHVIFILHENKTFDSMLGNVGAFGPFASQQFNNPDGTTRGDPQFSSVSFSTQAIAKAFATGVNYYSDSEESDAGHQFCASGTASDYTEKTLLVKAGRGLLVNKNFEPEDYPASGYIFNNLARHGRNFKDYGAMIRIDGTDTGTSTPTSINDRTGAAGTGYPQNNTPTNPNNVGDVTSATAGLGQSYFLQLPVLAVLGGTNPNGEPRIDKNYPGYTFNISDQRRAQEFIKDFDRMARAGTMPEFIYLYQPNDHTGGAQTKNVPQPTAAQQVADGDVALGMVVQHIMKSPIYYDADTDTGAAIFITYDDAQSTADHIHEHRTPVMVVSPFAKPGYAAKRHYSTASIVKTEELLLGLPPNNLGDLFATDMREFFQPKYNHITANDLGFNTIAARYEATPPGRRIWQMVSKLDTSAPDRDSRRLGLLARISMAADRLYKSARAEHSLQAPEHRNQQRRLLALARAVVEQPARDADD